MLAVLVRPQYKLLFKICLSLTDPASLAIPAGSGLGSGLDPGLVQATSFRRVGAGQRFPA